MHTKIVQRGYFELRINYAIPPVLKLKKTL